MYTELKKIKNKGGSILLAYGKQVGYTTFPGSATILSKYSTILYSKRFNLFGNAGTLMLYFDWGH